MSLAFALRSSRRSAIAATMMALPLAAFGVPSSARSAEVLAVKFPHGVMQQCSSAKTARFTVQGSGTATIKIALMPYKSLGQSPNIPVTFWLVTPGREPSFARGIPLPGLESTKYTQLGRDVSKTSWSDGAPLEIEQFFRITDAKEFVIDVRASPQCWMMPQRPYWQEGQEIHVTATAGGGAIIKTAGATDGSEAEPSRQLFSNMNTGAVLNGPTRATVFTLRARTRIAKITTYHWNNGRGAKPGTIALRSSTGQQYGPWQAAGAPGMGGVANVNWVVTPNITLPAGTYTVVDSNPSSWSRNAGSGNAGMGWVEGYAE